MTDTFTTDLPAPVESFDLSRPHFVGIGGKGMRSLAYAYAASGYQVSGSDANNTAALHALRAAGCTVQLGHDGCRSEVAAASCVVVSTAVPADNPEVLAARAAGVPVVHRSDALAALMRGRVGIAVAGTHGKSTTTAMLGHMLRDYDPSYVVGADLAHGGPGGRIGSGSFFVAEADESDRSFARYSPHVAVVLNVDDDHPEVFAGMGEVYAAYRLFAGTVVPGGTLVLPADDLPGGDLAAGLPKVEGLRVLTFGRSSSAWLRVLEVQTSAAGSRMTVLVPGVGRLAVVVPLLGEHNAMNAAAALAAGIAAGADARELVNALAGFGGVERRLARVGECRGVTVLDSFAHHPTAIRADIAAARELTDNDGRVFVLFEGSGWQRVRHLGAEMGRALAEADRVGLLGICDAVAQPIPGLTVAAVAATIPAGRIIDADDLLAAVAGRVQPGDVIVCMGTGTVALAGPQVLDNLRAVVALALM